MFPFYVVTKSGGRASLPCWKLRARLGIIQLRRTPTTVTKSKSYFERGIILTFDSAFFDDRWRASELFRS